MAVHRSCLFDMSTPWVTSTRLSISIFCFSWLWSVSFPENGKSNSGLVGETQFKLKVLFTLSIQNIGYLKSNLRHWLDTFGNCIPTQITHLWKFELNCSSKLQVRKIASGLKSFIQIQILRGKLPFSKTTLIQRESFPTIFYTINNSLKRGLRSMTRYQVIKFVF